MNITIIGNTSGLSNSNVKKLETMGILNIIREVPKTEDKLADAINNTEILVATPWVNLNKSVLSKAKKLKMISLWSTDYDNVDLDAAASLGIAVSNIPNYAATSVAEHTFALILSLSRKTYLADVQVKKGTWDRREFKGFELEKKKLGLIGVGNIGIKVAELANAFGMEVLAFTKNPKKERKTLAKIKYVNFDTILKNSDIITIHAALNPETEKILDEKAFSLMKTGVVIINTSRGKLIDEKALIKALQSGKVSAAGLDVFEIEPPHKDNPLLKMDKVILTPHCSSYTKEAMGRCDDICVENVEKFLQGKPQNIINSIKP